ncbi:MAG TPA: glycosyltransferase [Polyangia bacterium]|nr:glycosyltransferase [Polyangia bacterium]
MVAAFLWAAAALLAYTYFGYPALIGACARLRPRRRRGALGGELPVVTAVLPVFDGAALLPAKIESLLAQDYPADRLEILVYCDGCGDDSEAVARALAAAPAAGGRIRVFAEPARRGKPTALNRLFPEARGELVLLGDVRQPLSANAVRALAAALADPDVGCATGRLVLTGGEGSGVYWRYEEWIRWQESCFRGVVGMTGAIAMMRRRDFAPLPEGLVLDDVWMPMRLVLEGRRVEVVREAEARDTAFADEREFGRKVRTLAGNFQLFALLPALLLPRRNPIWLETFSHKVLRLIAPWLMVALAAASAWVAFSGAGGLAARGLFWAQAAFYLAALAGARAGRLAGVARTFVVLNAAAVVGLWRHLTGRQRITW